jgi:hypothetical protein
MEEGEANHLEKLGWSQARSSSYGRLVLAVVALAARRPPPPPPRTTRRHHAIGPPDTTHASDVLRSLEDGPEGLPETDRRPSALEEVDDDDDASRMRSYAHASKSLAWLGCKNRRGTANVRDAGRSVTKAVVVTRATSKKIEDNTAAFIVPRSPNRREVRQLRA